MIAPPRRLSLRDQAWIAAFVIACLLVTGYFLLFGGALSHVDPTDLPPNPGLGIVFCMMPLSLAAIPPALGRRLFASSRMARQMIARGDLYGALDAYRRQIALLNRFPVVDRMRALFCITSNPHSFREDLFIDMAHLHMLLNDLPRATACLWRCLRCNPHNEEALALLDQIGRIPQDGIKGW